MKQLVSVFSFLGLLALMAPAACGSSENSAEEEICDPGQYAVCICRNGNFGTRLCNDDGLGFSSCQKDGQDLCPGSEVPTDKDGNPLDNDNPQARDLCPGKALTIDGAEITRVTGDTSSSQSRQNGLPTGACVAGANTNEHVYAITPEEDGILEVTMTPLAPLDGVLYARRGDCDKGIEVACSSEGDVGGNEALRFPVIGGELYYIFADGKDGTKGSYNIDFSLDPGPICGNGKLDQLSEACDDKNNTPGDGCGPTCLPDGNPPTAGVCPGMPFVLSGAPIAITGQTTVGYAATYARQGGVCGAGTSPSPGVGSPDRVYAVTARKTGTMVVSTSNASFDHQIYVRTNCTELTAQIACASLASGPGGETAEFPVQDGSTYYVIVDGLITGSGTYDITFSIP